MKSAIFQLEWEAIEELLLKIVIPINRLCDWKQLTILPLEGHKIAFGILKAIVAHLYLAWIHPLGWEWKNCSIGKFLILLDSEILTPAAHLLVTSLTKLDEYYRQLNTTQKDGDIIHLLNTLFRGLLMA